MHLEVAREIRHGLLVHELGYDDIDQCPPPDTRAEQRRRDPAV
jgi:hypothetical protein